MKIGTKIKRAREKKNVSLQNLSRQIDVPFSYLEKIENNTLDPKTGTLKRICEALKIEVSSLFPKKTPGKAKLEPLPPSENEEMAQVTPAISKPKELTETERMVNDFNELYSRGFRFFDQSKGDDIGHSIIKHNKDGSFIGYTKNGMKKTAEKGLTYDGKELKAEDVEMIFNAFEFVVNHKNLNMRFETNPTSNQVMSNPKN